jgi:hypothetical protein
MAERRPLPGSDGLAAALGGVVVRDDNTVHAASPL